MATARVLFDNGPHKVLCFDQLVTGDGVQSNQFGSQPVYTPA